MQKPSLIMISVKTDKLYKFMMIIDSNMILNHKYSAKFIYISCILNDIYYSIKYIYTYIMSSIECFGCVNSHLEKFQRTNQYNHTNK